MAKSSQGGDQLVREARIALPILGLLFLAFVFAGYRRFSGWGDAPPANVPTQQPSGSDDSNPTPAGAPPESQPTLPGAEIRRPPNLDRLNQPLPDQNRTRRNPPTSKPPQYQRLPTEPRSPARDSGASAQPRELPPTTDTAEGISRLNVETKDSNAPESLAHSSAPGSNSFDGNASRQGSFDNPGPVTARPSLPQLTPPGQPVTTRQSDPPTIRRTEFATPDPNPEHREEASPPPSSPSAASVEIRLQVGEQESYWTIAERAYGSGQYFRAVHALLQSRGLTGNLAPGTELLLPPFAELAQRYGDLIPELGETPAESEFEDERFAIVADGKATLFEIAAEHLGQAARFAELLQLNRDRLPRGFGANDRVPAGTLIQFPRD